MRNLQQRERGRESVPGSKKEGGRDREEQAAEEERGSF